METPHVLRQFQTAFEQYWQEGEFEEYDPERDRRRLAAALAEERRRDTADALALHLDVRPHPFQQTILDQLAAERARGRTRNLVVAATEYRPDRQFPGRPTRLGH